MEVNVAQSSQLLANRKLFFRFSLSLSHPICSSICVCCSLSMGRSSWPLSTCCMLRLNSTLATFYQIYILIWAYLFKAHVRVRGRNRTINFQSVSFYRYHPVSSSAARRKLASLGGRKMKNELELERKWKIKKRSKSEKMRNKKASVFLLHFT